MLDVMKVWGYAGVVEPKGKACGDWVHMHALPLPDDGTNPTGPGDTVTCNDSERNDDGPCTDSWREAAGKHPLDHTSMVNDCAAHCCSDQGVCIDGDGASTCTCDDGFAGTVCETDIDECAGAVDCGNGECVDGTNAYTCACTDGWDGADCKNNIDDCAGVDCSGHGICVDGVAVRTCECDGEFTGDDCETAAPVVPD